ncbi:DNA-directed RNA polymerases I, II and III (nucleomorph) [Bigelowiella natans]|uniref:DNA-directed RNA polymerases I, II and III n=1 Tax=Bigelowiella natans TaxID=227086 RepID=Q3LW90_BIGNA|nr:DNA-directed RNA polymerases I, II and III [Bigelowiella natans]ABA27276.1 DNA-directed RNA polymerases I, II and III [Bigelowiella natans]
MKDTERKFKQKTYLEYVCGKCGATNEISIKDNIICNICHFNILFKKRSIRVKKIQAV